MWVQDKLRDVEDSVLVAEERFARLLGLGPGAQALRWHNTTLPVLVTHASGDRHAEAVSFVRAAHHLPYTVLLYNLGLKPYSLAVVSVNFFISCGNMALLQQFLWQHMTYLLNIKFKHWRCYWLLMMSVDYLKEQFYLTIL